MKKIKERIENLGLSVKKEFTILIGVDVLLLISLFLVIYFVKEVLYISIVTVIILAFNFLYLSRYSTIERKLKEDNIENFVSIFTFFKIYIKNGYNVYTALKEIMNFANPFVLDRLAILTHEIDEDKTIAPFIKFAREFDLLIIEQLMINIYQMIDEGNTTSYLTQFEMLFSKLSNENYEKAFARKEKRLSNTTIYALVGSALLIVMICFGVVAIIGDMLNGL